VIGDIGAKKLVTTPDSAFVFSIVIAGTSNPTPAPEILTGDPVLFIWGVVTDAADTFPVAETDTADTVPVAETEAADTPAEETSDAADTLPVAVTDAADTAPVTLNEAAETPAEAVTDAADTVPEAVTDTADTVPVAETDAADTVPVAVTEAAETPAEAERDALEIALATFNVSPTNNFFAIAAPPAVVNVPPFVALTASVLFDIPSPPENSTDAVEEADEDTVESNCVTPDDSIIIDAVPCPDPCNLKAPALFLIVNMLAAPSNPVKVDAFKKSNAVLDISLWNRCTA